MRARPAHAHPSESAQPLDAHWALTGNEPDPACYTLTLVTPLSPLSLVEQKSLKAALAELQLRRGEHNQINEPMSFTNHCSHALSKCGTVGPSLFISTLLKACRTIRNLEQVHAQIIQKGIEQDNFVISQFVCRCNSFSNIGYASSVFDRVCEPNVYLWNSVIKGYRDRSSVNETISIFNRMKSSKVTPDEFTFPSLIKACSSVSAIREGRAIHGSIVRYGIDTNIFVSTSLIDLYGKCREIECARKIFDGMSCRNEFSWTAMIVSYMILGDLAAAGKLFNQIPCRNLASWNAMIGGYVKFGDLTSAKNLFDQMPEKNAVSFTSLICGYAKAGDMASARFLFDQSPVRDIVSWSALISGYVQNGKPNEAVKIFFEMHSKNVRPDEFVMVSLMSACSQVGSLELAKWIDSYVVQNLMDLRQAHVTAALIDMNAKCGNLERASYLFEEMPKRDLFSYCSMIQGLSIHGLGEQVVRLFARMLDEGLIPDDVAFTVVLNGCSHAGLVEEGCFYFNSMKNDYSITPSPDHYACMVDLLGRSGNLEAAYDLIKSMPVEPHAGAWGALLGACRLHSDIELGEAVASRLFKLEPHSAGSYVLLSNIYAAADRWLDVSNVRNMMREKGIRKIPGVSWI
ncbi:putative pentatricopeptide repeat-containing protein At5g37570 [Telopea speciosissima]|uniref:putative pentatricopeptide repeat-containing protein At5g37570 n=1 Tax=Telopea speciosissima TaxID=54955 RepID=UPI001CC3D231|nr:putative pentatricopeptide repeat-containing protein At5g37570 [Telopea speciosissima]